MNYNGENMLGEEWKSGSSMDNKSIITYAGDEALFSTIKNNLLQAIPLDSVEWRRSFGRPIKSIKLNATFIPFSRDVLPNEKDWHLIKQPIFHIYFSECSDLDVYKLTIRDDIDSWLKTLGQYNIQDWMIVLVETYDIKKTNKLIPRTTVLDKIRSDFAAKHGDRCLSVINPIKSESRSAESWRGLISRIRHLTLTAYDKTLSKFEETIREQRERRNQLCWNFCHYFLLQEELAFVLEMLGIYDEALVQYDELDALFTQFVLNSDVGETPSWLSTFQSPLNNWAGVKLENTIDHNLRKLISDCKSSLLDLRSYLFSRQCAMLLLLNKPWEVAQRCLSFVHNTLSELRILEVQKPKGSIECWSFLCSLEVLQTCQLRISNSDNGQQLDLCSLHTAPLWALASDKLGELGKLCGLMPGNEPTSEQLHTVVYLIAGMGDSPDIKGKLTPTDRLKGALSSKDVFKRQYLEHTELAMGTYKHIGRIRSARYIGKELAKFYCDLGEYQKAAAFLVDAINTYVDENWLELAGKTRLELAQCYKRMDDIERYTKLCSIIASSDCHHMTVRNTYYEEMLGYMSTLKLNCPLVTELEDTFDIIELEVNVTDKIVNDCIVSIDVTISSRLPRGITCKSASISIEDVKRPSSGRRKGSKPVPEQKPPLLTRCKIADSKVLNSLLIPIPVYSYQKFNEDKSLASVWVIDRITRPIVTRTDSSKHRKLSDCDFTKALRCQEFTLNNGINRFTVSKRDDQPGFYKVSQLSIVIDDKMEYRSGIIHPRICYEVAKTQPLVSVNSRDLVAGLLQDAELVVSSGSVRINAGAKLKLWTSRGLSVKLGDDKSRMGTEGEVSLEDCEPFGIIKLKMKVFADLPPKKDASSMEHKLNIQTPWGSEENVSLHFGPPLMSSMNLHTAKQRKFIQIIVTGLTGQLLQLMDPQLSTTSSVDVTFKNLNPIAGQKIIVGNCVKVSFMWEMEMGQDEKITVPIKIDFRIKYSAIDKDGDDTVGDYDDPLHISKLQKLEERSYTYRCNFDVADYVTMFMVSSKVEASGSGGEFCRAGSMCHLCLTVTRVLQNTNTNPPPQLMYEVLADQSMWAVCGRTAGIVTLDTLDRQSVTLDVMPLTSGYLPLPVVRLSRYIPAIEAKNDTSRKTEGSVGPRLEPFSPGQVYNASKAQQVHVLPAAPTETN